MNGPLPDIRWEPAHSYRCTKTRYSKVEAQTVLNARMRSGYNRAEKLRIYSCQECGGLWHLTSKEDRFDYST